MTPGVAFVWGVLVGGLVVRLLASAYERLLERRIAVAEEHAQLVRGYLAQAATNERELTASRVEMAFNFAAMRRAARDEVRS